MHDDCWSRLSDVQFALHCFQFATFKQRFSEASTLNDCTSKFKQHEWLRNLFIFICTVFSCAAGRTKHHVQSLSNLCCSTHYNVTCLLISITVLILTLPTFWISINSWNAERWLLQSTSYTFNLLQQCIVTPWEKSFFLKKLLSGYNISVRDRVLVLKLIYTVTTWQICWTGRHGMIQLRCSD